MKEIIEKAFDAGCAYTMGNHELFRQVHQNKKEYVEQAMKTLPTCNWNQDEEGNWNMQCVDKFTLIAGIPSENNMNFCCNCGKKLIEISYSGKVLRGANIS